MSKFIHFFFLSLVTLVMSSCVPKVTEKKAICGTNEAFSNITRSCYSTLPANKAAIASNISPSAFLEDTQSIIYLSYTDYEIDLATQCQLTDLTNVTITQACTCDGLGVCSVGVTGTANYTGSASFFYSVKTNGTVSSTAKATLTISPVNDAPTISDASLLSLASRTTNEDTVKEISITVADVDNTLTCAGSVSVIANTNTVLIPNASIIISGSIPNCVATITPAANLSGSADITLRVTDGLLTNSTAFTFNVTSVNDAPSFTAIATPAAFSEDGTTSITFTVTDVDSNNSCTAAYLSVSSSNLILLPFSILNTVIPEIAFSGSTVVSGSGSVATCTATITPIANMSGTTSIVIAANDLSGGVASTPVSPLAPLVLTVNAINDAPLISSIADTSTNEDVPKVITFTISDIDNTLSCSTSVTATSSDLTVIPVSGIVFSGTAPNCTATITPAAEQSSVTPVTVTFTVSDTLLTASEPFDLTVVTVDDLPYFDPSLAVTTVDTNEGGMVVAGPFKVDEDQANSSGENNQSLTITSITSDNTTVLSSAVTSYTSSKIKIFYDLNDNGSEDPGEDRDLSEGLSALVGDDVHGHSFYLKLYPNALASGGSNIAITATDGGPTPVVSNFSLVVHPISATHGGWTNISAVGIKSDKSGNPVSLNDIQCNYNKSTDTNKCNTSDSNCTGVVSPAGTVLPDAAGIIYWDSASKKCYRSQSTTISSWIELKTTCPITRISPTVLASTITASATSLSVSSTSKFPLSGMITIGSEKISYTGKTSTTFTGLTRGASSTTAAIHLTSAAVINTASSANFIVSSGSPVASGENQYYLDTTSKSCYSSKELATPGTWGWNTSPYIPAKVTLAWNSFPIIGTSPDNGVSVSGWNVYRREKDYDYDFKNGFLKNISTDTMSISNASTKTFTDTTAVAGKVYYYLVRPVENKRFMTVYTPDVFSEVRVLTPVENMSFVHRWMVNQEMCNSMHMTTTTTLPNQVDPNHNYRCPYKGPGESTIAPGYYDIEKDMLVDISESGCPYTADPLECSSTNNGCVSVGDPNSSGLNLTASAGSIYYDRGTGSCWRNTIGTNVWLDVNSGAGAIVMAATKVSSALNPPLVNISKANAKLICDNRIVSTSITSALTGTTPPATVASLPSKKEFIAYSSGPLNLADSLLTTLEQGFSLNSTSRCNSSNADGLEVAYTNSNVPATSYAYAIPGNNSSGIRSMFTGSIPMTNNFSTEACSSRFGIQDVYGNVSEWVRDSMSCGILVNTKLTVALQDTDTSMTVTSTASFPVSGSVIIGTETISYTGTTLNTLTGLSRSAPADHPITELVYYLGAQTLLKGGISSAETTTINVDDVSSFAASGTITIGSEDISYTGTGAGTLTGLTRGVNSTTAADHFDNDLLFAKKNNFVCKTSGGALGTDFERYDFKTNAYSDTPVNSYAFDLITGPYLDSDASGRMSIGDSFLLDWTFYEGYFGASKFNFPMGMPINGNISSSEVSSSLAIPYLLSIGSSSGITQNQLHEDGIIVNGAKVNDTVANPTQIGSFAQGGSYLSGSEAGRYSSELVPDSTVRPDIGFRCFVPVINGNYPTDTKHTYSY